MKYVLNMHTTWKLAAIFVLLFSFHTLAQNPSQPEIKTRIEKGIEQTIVNDFRGAALTFQGLIKDYPQQPFGYFYLAATYQAEMLDSEDFREINHFKRLMGKTISAAKQLTKQNGPSVWSTFFEGSAYLYLSFMDSKRKKLWGAYRNAVKGVGRLEKVILLDSSFYDAYLGVGSYKYWKSVKAKALTWLPFISDERSKGMKMVKLAIEKGNFVKLVGRDQLAWMLLDNKQKERALQLAVENHNQYPQSRFFLWTLMEIYYKSEKFDEALPLYKKMMAMIRETPENNHYNEIKCLLSIAEMYYQRGEYSLSDLYLSEIFQLQLNKEIQDRTKSKQKRARELKKRCAKELAKLGYSSD